MNYQEPAQGVLKNNDWGDSKVYRIVCDCGNNDCDHNMWVEADEHDITVTIYTTTRSNFWSKSRWQHLWTLLTRGYIDTETSICLRKQVALNYAETLKSAINDVEEFRKQNVKN